jgi:hypothetical protein
VSNVRQPAGMSRGAIGWSTWITGKANARGDAHRVDILPSLSLRSTV